MDDVCRELLMFGEFRLGQLHFLETAQGLPCLILICFKEIISLKREQFQMVGFKFGSVVSQAGLI